MTKRHLEPTLRPPQTLEPPPAKVRGRKFTRNDRAIVHDFVAGEHRADAGVDVFGEHVRIHRDLFQDRRAPIPIRASEYGGGGGKRSSGVGDGFYAPEFARPITSEGGV